ncbi:MAG TPA: AbrB/MazE/SpoVT family DNA-binding domain-containing protein [Ktedonobacterales bacterium]|nr:AbrB/MazE/SpoVT family DNA-binding domain-containing protein [Ktedonobacterales bacterium]
MYLLKLRKSDDDTSVTLPADVIEALHLAENDILTFEQINDQIILRREHPEPQANLVPHRHRWTAEELLKLPLEERDRILAAQAALAEEEYRTNRDLTDFEAFGEGDL